MSWQSVFSNTVAGRSELLKAMEFQKVGISFYGNGRESEHIFGIVYDVVSLIGTDPAELLILFVSSPRDPDGSKLAIRITDVIGVDGEPSGT